MANVKDIISNPSSERAVISICLRNIDKLIECNSLSLSVKHFASKINKALYSVICYLAEEGVVSFDSEMIFSMIKNEEVLKELNQIGGREYIDSLLNSHILEENINIYINMIKDCYLKRTIYDISEELKESVLGLEETSEIISEAQKKIMDISLDGINDDDEYKVGSNAYSRISERTNNPTDVAGIRTGWSEFDKVTQGLCANDLVVIVAPSKTGKSTFLLNICHNLSIKGDLKGLYIDTEMSDEEQEDRLIAINSEVPYTEIQNGMFSKDTAYGDADTKKMKVYSSTNSINNGNLIHVYVPNFTIESVTALIRKYKIKENIDYVVFDYIKLPNEDTKGDVKEYQKLGYLTTCLKNMAGICNIPVITAGQTNRDDLDTTSPDASSIGGSYRILQMASKLFFLRNKLPYEIQTENGEKGNMKLHIAYQRNGGTGVSLDFNFNKPILKIFEC